MKRCIHKSFKSLLTNKHRNLNLDTLLIWRQKIYFKEKVHTQRIAGNKFWWLRICSAAWCQGGGKSRQCPWMILTWTTQASLTRQDYSPVNNYIWYVFKCFLFVVLFSVCWPLLTFQEDRLRRWSEDVVDNRLRDNVRLNKLYRQGLGTYSQVWH